MARGNTSPRAGGAGGDLTPRIVETLEEARAAVAEARRCNRKVLLVTAPGACARLGPAYLLEMMRQAGADTPALIDCAGDAGYAMLALRLGWRDIHLKGAPSIVARIADMTRSCGGTFHHALPGNGGEMPSSP